jgi:hypothetical protein
MSSHSHYRARAIRRIVAIMRRRQWIEIADQTWCPTAVRDGLTDYLQFVIDRTAPYAAAAPLLTDALRASALPVDGASALPNAAVREVVHDVVDLGAGAGGPWRALAGQLAADGTPVRVHLTDAHPNLAAFARLAAETGGVVTGESRPVAADAVPTDLVGFRTCFSAFHHFPPPLARRVLADARAQRVGIAVFEATRRDARALAFMLVVPLLILVVTPALRPFRWSRLLLTYLLPAIPLVALVDGVVSCLRTYTPDELRALAAPVEEAELAHYAGEGYAWTAGESGTGPIPMTYLIGYPRSPINRVVVSGGDRTRDERDDR